MIRLRLFRKFGLAQKPPRWLVSLLVSYSSFVLLAPEILFASSSPFTASKELKSREIRYYTSRTGETHCRWRCENPISHIFLFSLVFVFHSTCHSLSPVFTICKILQRIYISLSVPVSFSFFFLLLIPRHHPTIAGWWWRALRTDDLIFLSYLIRLECGRERRELKGRRGRARKKWKTGLNNGLDVTSQNLKGFPA